MGCVTKMPSNKTLNSLNHNQIMRWTLTVIAQYGLPLSLIQAQPSIVLKLCLVPKPLVCASTQCGWHYCWSCCRGWVMARWCGCYQEDAFHCPQPLPCLPVLFRLQENRCCCSFSQPWSTGGRRLYWSPPSVKAVLCFLVSSIGPSHSIPSSCIILKITPPWIPYIL